MNSTFDGGLSGRSASQECDEMAVSALNSQYDLLDSGIQHYPSPLECHRHTFDGGLSGRSAPQESDKMPASALDCLHLPLPEPLELAHLAGSTCRSFQSVHTNMPHSGGDGGIFGGRVARLPTRQGLLHLPTPP